MLSLPAAASASGETVLARAVAGFGAGGRTGGAGSCIVFLRNSSEAAPVLAASRSSAVRLLLGGSTTCVAVSVFFVHVNLMALGQPHAEFLLQRVFRIREQARAELAVFPGSREEAFCRVDGLLHCGPLALHAAGAGAPDPAHCMVRTRQMRGSVGRISRRRNA